MKKIILCCHNISKGPKGTVQDPEKSWYSYNPNLFNCSFVKETSQGHIITLMKFFLPKEYSELVPGNRPEAGNMELRISDDLKDYEKISKIDVKSYLDRWPMEIYQQAAIQRITEKEVLWRRGILMLGFFRLTAAHLGADIQAIAADAQQWEQTLKTELRDYSHFSTKTDQEISDGLLNKGFSENSHELRKFLLLASCYTEILTTACPTLEIIIRFDRGRTYPALYTGYIWQKNHYLKSWKAALSKG